MYLFMYNIYPTPLKNKTTYLSSNDVDYILDYNFFNKLILTKNGEKLSYVGVLIFQKVTINKDGDNCFEINTKTLGFIDNKRKVFIKFIKNNEIEYYYTE